MSEPTTGGAITGGNKGYKGGNSGSPSFKPSGSSSSTVTTIDLSSFTINSDLEDYEGEEKESIPNNGQDATSIINDDNYYEVLHGKDGLYERREYYMTYDVDNIKYAEFAQNQFINEQVELQLQMYMNDINLDNMGISPEDWHNVEDKQKYIMEHDPKIVALVEANSTYLDDFVKENYSQYGLTTYEEWKEFRANNEALIIEAESHDPRSDWERFVDGAKSTGATLVVGFTTLVSSVLKLGEDVSDGTTWLGGTILAGGARLFGADEFAADVETTVMDHIAVDQVGIINDELYGEGKLLSGVNEASSLKYNSDTAKGIQNVGEKGVLIVGATAATVATGGGATPLLIIAAGGLAAGGDSAETHFQDTENRDYWDDSIDIGFDAALGAIETYGYGQSGASLVKGFNTIRSIGLTGAKDMAKRTLNNFGSSTYRRVFAKGFGKALGKAGLGTLKNPSTWLETCAVISPEVKKGIKTGEWDWGTIATKTGGVLGSNYVSAVGTELIGLSDKAGRVAEAETTATEAFKNDSWIAANVPEEEFNTKVAAAEARAIEMEEAGVLPEEKFYEVWGADPGTKPDPSSYLPQDYIDEHLQQFTDKGASRLSSTDDYMKFVGNTTGTVGNPGTYQTPGKGTYTSGSEFMSVATDVDELLTKAGSSSDPYKTIADGLGMKDQDKFNSGVWRYDIAGSQLGGLNLRMPSGNEPGAYKLDWIPGGKTSGGAPEAIVDRFTGNGTTIKLENKFGPKVTPK